MNDILTKAADVTTDKAVELEVDILPTNIIHYWLQQWRVLPKKRLFTMTGTTYGNLIRISKLLLSIDIKVYELKNVLESNYLSITQNAETIAKVVAIAIHNKRSEPPLSLVKFILFNFSATEMVSTLGIVMKQMNVAGFMTSIISVRGLNVLESGIANARNANESEMSPKDQEEIIAPGI